MDLLVLDSDASFGETMKAALVDVNVSVVRSWLQLRSKFDALAANQQPIVVCSSEVDLDRCMEWKPRSLVIFWAQQLPSSVDVLRLMQRGVRDIWLPSESANDWAERLQWLNKLNVMVDAISSDSQRDIQTARVIQQSMWPQDGAVLSGYKFSRRLLPAAMLSGDFVDYFAVGARYLIFFYGGCRSHGVSPALLTAALKNISWRLQQRYGRPRFRTPAQMLEWINARVIDQSVDLHVAMFLALLICKPTHCTTHLQHTFLRVCWSLMRVR